MRVFGITHRRLAEDGSIRLLRGSYYTTLGSPSGKAVTATPEEVAAEVERGTAVEILPMVNGRRVCGGTVLVRRVADKVELIEQRGSHRLLDLPGF